MADQHDFMIITQTREKNTSKMTHQRNLQAI